MKDLKETLIKDLAHRLNQIESEKQKLDLEYNLIINELWRRIPSLKDDENIQPKVIKRNDN